METQIKTSPLRGRRERAQSTSSCRTTMDAINTSSQDVESATFRTGHLCASADTTSLTDNHHRQTANTRGILSSSQSRQCANNQSKSKVQSYADSIAQDVIPEVCAALYLFLAEVSDASSKVFRSWYVVSVKMNGFQSSNQLQGNVDSPMIWHE